AKDTHLGGMGWIIHDPHSSFRLQGASSRPCVSSALVAESLALKAGILAAQSSGIVRLACFSDCLELILLLNSGDHVNELEGIVTDIHLASLSFSSISFHHVSRTMNSQADALAKSALSCCIPSSGKPDSRTWMV
ncbi:hypothetical protein CARUB_v10010848mg, partial [Capsella rubella]